MRRTLAAALAAALLLTGGCARQRPASDEAKPAAVTAPATTHPTTPATGPHVGPMLDDIDKLLAGDSSPSEDQD